MASKITNNYLPELSAFLFGRRKPGMVTVNLTRRCNQRCIYCEVGSHEPTVEKDKLKVSDLYWIIDQMERTGIPKLSLCGGEPFLFNGIFEVIAYAGKKNIYCSITTNGMKVYLMNENELAILKENNTEINLSIDSFNDKIQELTRGHPKALSNALLALDKFKEEGIPVTVLTAISKYNFRDLSGFVISGYKKGIRQILFQPIIYYSNYPDQAVLKNKADLNVEKQHIPILLDELHKIQELEKKKDINTNVYRIIPWIRQYLETAAQQNGTWFVGRILPVFHCREIHTVIDISYDGGIQPCGLAPAFVSIFDDRDKGLMGLWSKATQSIRKDISNNNFRDYCNGCCHKFSRNMMASVMKYPLKNRQALLTLMTALIHRVIYKTRKKIQF